MKNSMYTKEEVKECIKKIKDMDTENTYPAKLRQEEKDIVNLARKCIQDSRDQNISNKDRTVLLEDALKLFITLWIKVGDKLSPSTFTTIAEAYLLRSRIFRPKGVNVPEKKKESINKGIAFAQKAVSLNMVNTEAWRIKGHLLLELERIDEDAVKKELKNDLESAIKNGCTDFNNAEDISIVLRFAELTNNTEYATLISKSGLKEIELEKARACKVINDENGIKGNMNGVIKRLYDLSFSDPLWEDTVNFLKLLKMPGNGCWKELSSGVYEACLHRERKTALLPLRWYWSRLNDLYDLAFLAANSPKEKAQIADNSKSRPSLRYTVWEDLCKKDPARKSEYTALMENEGMSGYVKNIKSQAKADKETITQLTRMQRDVTNIPEECKEKDFVIIHFYLNHLEGMGYAIIYDVDSRIWKYKEFAYKNLFNSYLTWHTNYNLSPFPEDKLKNSSMQLVDLCKEIGEAMPFLFNKSLIPNGKNVIFIPHGFLRRIPLHAAIKKGSLEFFPEDFKQPLTIEKLCVRIKRDIHNVSLDSLDNTLDWLNKLLKLPNFYCILRAEKPNLKISEVTNNLICKTKESRNKRPSDLNNEEQYNIMELHRLLLEEAYPSETPKCLRVFLQDHNCCYLPMWPLYSNNSLTTSDEYVLFKKFREGEESYLDNLPAWFRSSAKEANPEDMINGFCYPPKLLAILCHGKANKVNPFNAKLELKNGDVTYLDIQLAEGLDLSGSHVFLGACETDLVCPLSSTVDEHPSILNAFLVKGAKEILGAMWISYFSISGKILDRWHINKTSFFLEVNKWQREQINIWYELKKDPCVFYKTIVFRVVVGVSL